MSERKTTRDYRVGFTTARWDREKVVWYADGPGGPGYYGATMSPELYVDTAEEAERWLPMLQLAYDAGKRHKLTEIQTALGIR